jgi:hypothetical protein
MALGKKTGGRQRGSLNKGTQAIEEKLAALGCDPLQGLALIATGQETCGICLGKKKLTYRRRKDGELLFDPGGKLMPCVNCFGSGKEPIALGYRLKARAELANYVAPKRKAIEVTPHDSTKGDFTLSQLLATFREAVNETDA